jgi:hypothetical protein
MALGSSQEYSWGGKGHSVMLTTLILLGLFFDPEGGDMFVGLLSVDYLALHPRRQFYKLATL